MKTINSSLLVYMNTKWCYLMSEWMNERMREWVNELMSEWMSEWMDEWISCKPSRQYPEEKWNSPNCKKIVY